MTLDHDIHIPAFGLTKDTVQAMCGLFPDWTVEAEADSILCQKCLNRAQTAGADAERLLWQMVQPVGYFDEKSGEVHISFYTTTDYVDCECETCYIHPVAWMPEGFDPATLVICLVCRTVYDDAPNSRADEVLACGLPLDVSTLEQH